MFRGFSDIDKGAIEAHRTLVVAAAHDGHTLEAVFEAAEELGTRYILVGDREKIISISADIGVSPDPETIVDANDNLSCASISVDLIRTGGGNALMKGIIETGTLLKAVLNKETGIRGSGILSHLALLEAPGYHKLVGVTDGGMIPSPTLEQKIGIVKNAVGFFNNIGYIKPKVAALCASETVSPKIQETVEAAELQAMCREGRLGDCILEGPISFDLAVSKESAEIKGYKSEISGETDILLVPNIAVGNVFMKGQIYWAGAKMAGCVIGAEAPIILASRGASAEEKLLSIMISMM